MERTPDGHGGIGFALSQKDGPDIDVDFQDTNLVWNPMTVIEYGNGDTVSVIYMADQADQPGGCSYLAVYDKDGIDEQFSLEARDKQIFKKALEALLAAFDPDAT